MGRCHGGPFISPPSSLVTAHGDMGSSLEGQVTVRNRQMNHQQKNKKSDNATKRTDKQTDKRTDTKTKRTDSRTDKRTDPMTKRTDKRTDTIELRKLGTPSEDELLASSQETVDDKAVGHSTPSTINQPITSADAKGQKRQYPKKGPSRYKLYQRSLAILGRISKNEAEGKTHPKDAADKARCQKVVDEYLAFQATQKAEAVKRNRSQDEGCKTAKKLKTSHTALTPKPAKRAFNEVARDHLQTALVDELTNRGKPALERWSEIEARLSRIVVDHVMASPQGQVPGYDSMEVVRGYRVIKCDDQFSVDFLQNAISKIQSDWEGLRLKLIPASEIPRRPRARIWIPNMEFEAKQLIPYLQAHNRTVPMDDWSIIKAEAPQKNSVSFLLQISEESIEPLGKVDNKLRFGVRKAHLKLFRSANPEDEQDEVDDANELLMGMQLEEAGSTQNDGANEQHTGMQLDAPKNDQ
ncbi:uncharacterized protein LOC129250620 [Anastrepha obliqua]|uniref:uncharacterized protein LOC129250620 n=2 Tax=Anastrepha obliqua TaxID=95512 RepID=UPI0024096DCD|nr:uncharacterized protein LOC129250620 [Anastrepha obliqua]